MKEQNYENVLGFTIFQPPSIVVCTYVCIDGYVYYFMCVYYSDNEKKNCLNIGFAWQDL